MSKKTVESDVKFSVHVTLIQPQAVYICIILRCHGNRYQIGCYRKASKTIKACELQSNQSKKTAPELLRFDTLKTVV